MSDINKLLKVANDYMQNSYSPYSHFKVGAAVLTKSGQIFGGCNVENSSYGGTICAERTAILKAISENHTDFEAIAIVNNADIFAYPCGICLQFMSEFIANDDMKIIVSDGKEIEETTFKKLMPSPFNIKK